MKVEKVQRTGILKAYDDASRIWVDLFFGNKGDTGPENWMLEAFFLEHDELRKTLFDNKRGLKVRLTLEILDEDN